MKTLTSKAFAKINLTLDVFPKGEDGYHGLRSVMQTVSLCDEVSVTLCSDASGVDSDARRAGIEDDICVRAANAFISEFLSHKTLGVYVKLKKNIPVSAGLGGGSSDGAAVIRLLAEEFGVTDRQRLIDLCRGIGSDLPFFLEGGMALIEGTGESITPLPYRFDKRLLLVKPTQGTSAGGVYRIFDTLARPPAHSTEVFINSMERGVLDLSVTSNSLQPAAIAAAPESGEILDRMYALGAQKAMVSGSGSTVMGFFADEDLQKAAEALSGYERCELCEFVY